MSIIDMMVRCAVSGVVSGVVRKNINESRGFAQSFYNKNKVSRCPDCYGLYSRLDVCPLCGEPLGNLYYERRQYYEERDYDRNRSYSEQESGRDY